MESMDWSESRSERVRLRRKDTKDRSSRDTKVRDRERNRDHLSEWAREKDRDIDKDRRRQQGQEKEREEEKDGNRVKEKSKGKDKEHARTRDREGEKKDDKSKLEDNDSETEQLAARKARPMSSELEERILQMKEERRKNSEKEKALHKSKLLEEQDNIVQGQSDDEETDQPHNLAGVKVLHGIDKVMEGGAVVLTLKDKNILAGGDINEEVDMLEKVEIGEQNRRDDAYKAAKKMLGTYNDKFNDDPYSETYNNPNNDEGETLDERGHVVGEAEKRLEQLRRQLDGVSSNTHVKDLNLPRKIPSYYTPEEMLQFKKPKKKKALRQKDKLDVDALEAEAISAGLGVGDLGPRSNAKRLAIKEEQDRTEAERRDKAYQAAYAKADESSKSLRIEQTLPFIQEEDGHIVFVDDADDLHKSLERVRKISLKNKEEEARYGAEAVARLATTTASSPTTNEQDSESEAIIGTETKQFVITLQCGKAQKCDAEDAFMEEEDEPIVSKEEDGKDDPSVPTGVKDMDMEENHSNEQQEEEIVAEEIIHEAAVGKGLASALKLLQERGTLKETVDWGGRNMDKKKSKLVVIPNDDDDDEPPKKTQQQPHHKDFVYHEKDIRIERFDEFGRRLTSKEEFQILSHKFHGKGPGKMKQEKRMKQFQEELELKKMKSSDTPSMSMERMRAAQAQLKTPYIILN